jgi:hypothetical protein
MGHSKNTILNYITTKKYVIIIIFIITTCINYIIIDKTWKNKFMYTKYLMISKNLSQLHVKYRENIMNNFISSFNRTNLNPNLNILNLDNGYDAKLTFFGSLDHEAVNKLIEDQILKSILNIKNNVLDNLKSIKNKEIPIWANNLIYMDIESQKILIEELSAKIKKDVQEYEKTVSNISSEYDFKEIDINNLLHLELKSLSHFLENTKIFINDIEKVLLLTSKEDKEKLNLHIYTYQSSRSHIQLIKDLSLCEYKKLNHIQQKEICKKQKNILGSALDYFYYVYTLKSLVNFNKNSIAQSISEIQKSWENENIIDYDKETFYEIDRIGPSNFLIIIISIFNSLVLTSIFSLLLMNLKYKLNFSKN